MGGDDLCHLAGQLQRVRTLVGGVVVREMLTDVPQRRRTQHGIHDRVQQHIGIGMTQQALFKRDLNAAQNELAVLY